jgi:hypothetical protein
LGQAQFYTTPPVQTIQYYDPEELEGFQKNPGDKPFRNEGVPFSGKPQYTEVDYRWEDCPWTPEEIEAFNPFPTYTPNPMHQPQQHIHYSRTSRDFQPEAFTHQLQFQHKAVAKGPKLSFPEFDGTDPDGWIRKAEKYFELVGVPTEDRVQLAVLYIKGKAEFWWRGTGYSPNIVQWYQFCRWLGDRFSDTSTYEAVG